jgi:hypothetical protein
VMLSRRTITTARMDGDPGSWMGLQPGLHCPP